MSNELTNWAANAGKDLRDSFVLLSEADSTVAGGEETINYSGEYVFSTYGTLDGASASLYVDPVGQPEFNIWTDTVTGNAATMSVEGGMAVKLNQGDRVYAQLSSVGGSTSLTCTLAFNG